MGKRKPAEKRKDKAVRLQLTEEQYAEAQAVAKTIACSVPEVFRQGLVAMRQVAEGVKAGVSVELAMAGDDQTVQAKMKALKAIEDELCGPATASRRAGVTSRTFRNWLNNDPVFAQLADEAAAVGIEGIECELVKLAKAGKLTAIFGLLNAKHPDYGMIRTQLLSRVLGPFLDRVMQLAQRFLSTDDLHRFAAELGGHAERIALEATSGRR